MMNKYYVPSVREQPTITREMLDVLESTFSYVMPNPNMTIEEIMYNAGKQEVLNWLRDRVRNDAQDNRINRTMT